MNITVLPEPPYSSDLALADFFLFPKLKSSLKGRWFQMIQEITGNSDGATGDPVKGVPRLAVSRSDNGIGSSASMQEGSTLKVIRLVQL
jgi:hypothetical protein